MGKKKKFDGYEDLLDISEEEQMRLLLDPIEPVSEDHSDFEEEPEEVPVMSSDEEDFGMIDASPFAKSIRMSNKKRKKKEKRNQFSYMDMGDKKPPKADLDEAFSYMDIDDDEYPDEEDSGDSFNMRIADQIASSIFGGEHAPSKYVTPKSVRTARPVQTPNRMPRNDEEWQIDLLKFDVRNNYIYLATMDQDDISYEKVLEIADYDNLPDVLEKLRFIFENYDALEDDDLTEDEDDTPDVYGYPMTQQAVVTVKDIEGLRQFMDENRLYLRGLYKVKDFTKDLDGEYNLEGIAEVNHLDISNGVVLTQLYIGNKEINTTIELREGCSQIIPLQLFGYTGTEAIAMRMNEGTLTIILIDGTDPIEVDDYVTFNGFEVCVLMELDQPTEEPDPEPEPIPVAPEPVVNEPTPEPQVVQTAPPVDPSEDELKNFNNFSNGSPIDEALWEKLYPESGSNAYHPNHIKVIVGEPIPIPDGVDFRGKDVYLTVVKAHGVPKPIRTIAQFQPSGTDLNDVNAYYLDEDTFISALIINTDGVGTQSVLVRDQFSGKIDMEEGTIHIKNVETWIYDYVELTTIDHKPAVMVDQIMTR